MNNALLSHIYILKNIFTLKKSSTFANLLMEKPGADLLHLVLFISNQFISNQPSYGKFLSNCQGSTHFH